MMGSKPRFLRNNPDLKNMKNCPRKITKTIAKTWGMFSKRKLGFQPSIKSLDRSGMTDFQFVEIYNFNTKFISSIYIHVNNVGLIKIRKKKCISCWYVFVWQNQTHISKLVFNFYFNNLWLEPFTLSLVMATNQSS